MADRFDRLTDLYDRIREPYRRPLFVHADERQVVADIPLYHLAGEDPLRVCFRWTQGDAFDVEIVDYH